MERVKIQISTETKSKLDQFKSEFDLTFDEILEKLITFYNRIAPIIEEIEQVDNEEEQVCP